MTLDQAFEQARTLESAEVHAASYMGSSFPVQSAAVKQKIFQKKPLQHQRLPPQGLKNASFVEMTYTHEPFVQLEILLAETVEKRDITSECANLDLGETLQMWWLLQTHW
ncbi:hypothetical protein TNCV_1384911 [Trichonephila clavipes]|nr:hypothetical protein TNCV_1384911 [Trichonephila clavipes]